MLEPLGTVRSTGAFYFLVPLPPLVSAPCISVMYEMIVVMKAAAYVVMYMSALLVLCSYCSCQLCTTIVDADIISDHYCYSCCPPLLVVKDRRGRSCGYPRATVRCSADARYTFRCAQASALVVRQHTPRGSESCNCEAARWFQSFGAALLRKRSVQLIRMCALHGCTMTLHEKANIN